MLKGWKTRIVAASLALMGLLASLDPKWFTEIVGADNMGKVMIAYSVLFWLLRQITNTPAGKNK